MTTIPQKPVNQAPKPLPSQTGPTLPVTVPPVPTPPITGDGNVGFVSGFGPGPRVTGKPGK